jgi:poly(3-hydroxybutyrate) depolymerase
MIWLLILGCTATESGPEGPMRTTSFDGSLREYRLFVPESEGPHPVVLALHGGGGADESMLAPGKRIGMTSRETATALITPIGARGERGQWAPEDARFLIHILDEVSKETPIQSDRVHIIGFSGGGRLGYQAAAEYPDRIHAVATLHGRAGVRGPDGQWVAPFDPNKTGASGVHVFNFFGGLDPNRVGNTSGLGQEETLNLWEQANGATEETPTSLVHAPDDIEVWKKVNPQTGVSVVGAVEPGLGHEWPTWNITSDIFDFFNLP